MSDSNHEQQGTRERLLEAAGEVFAERGFEKATIREICRRAESNVAAVNYHFGDKENLYMETLQYAHEHADRNADEERAADADLPAVERFRAEVRSILARPPIHDRPSWFIHLMRREMIEPTQALDVVVQRTIRPRFERMVALVRELIGNRVPDERVRMCATSVVGQCIHLFHGRQIVSRLNPHVAYTPEGIEALADHVVSFSLAAFREIARQTKNEAEMKTDMAEPHSSPQA